MGQFAVPGAGFAAEDARWLLQTSLYTKHYHYSPDHNDHQHLVNVEYQRPDQWLIGGSAFDNSYSQPSQYIYVGKLFRPLQETPMLHFKLTGGFIHGYKDPYQDKIPMNSTGIAPAIIPAVGLSGKNVSTEINFFGFAGVMLTLGVLF